MKIFNKILTILCPLVILASCAHSDDPKSSQPIDAADNELKTIVIDEADFAVNGLTPPLFREELDYSFDSAALIDENLDIASDHIDMMDEERVESMTRAYGSYLLEVVRRNYSGEYKIFKGKDLPVLVVGAPESEIAIFPFDKVRGRLGGDFADDIDFYMQGIKQTLDSLEPGQNSLHI